MPPSPTVPRLPPPEVRTYRAQLGGIARALKLLHESRGRPSLAAVRNGRVSADALARILLTASRVEQYAAALAAGRRAFAERDEYWPGKSWRCGARTRSGAPCEARPVCGRRRCRMHGGASTGPKTAEGKLRALVNLRRGAG